MPLTLKSRIEDSLVKILLRNSLGLALFMQIDYSFRHFTLEHLDAKVLSYMHPKHLTHTRIVNKVFKSHSDDKNLWVHLLHKLKGELFTQHSNGEPPGHSQKQSIKEDDFDPRIFFIMKRDLTKALKEEMLQSPIRPSWFNAILHVSLENLSSKIVDIAYGLPNNPSHHTQRILDAEWTSLQKISCLAKDFKGVWSGWLKTTAKRMGAFSCVPRLISGFPSPIPWQLAENFKNKKQFMARLAQEAEIRDVFVNKEGKSVIIAKKIYALTIIKLNQAAHDTVQIPKGLCLNMIERFAAEIKTVRLPQGYLALHCDQVLKQEIAEALKDASCGMKECMEEWLSTNTSYAYVMKKALFPGIWN